MARLYFTQFICLKQGTFDTPLKQGRGPPSFKIRNPKFEIRNLLKGLFGQNPKEGE